MPTVILLRHGRTTANATGLLAGRTAGVKLDSTGQEQADRVGRRLAPVPLAAVISSPLERCRQTARAVLTHQEAAPESRTEHALSECDYGEWQGRLLKELVKEPLWAAVQAQPSTVTFPDGESMLGMQSRAVTAVRRFDARLGAEHGEDAVWVAVSHGDIIKSVLADALGMHLDLFQRINVDPASVSIVRYTAARPYVLASNTHAGDLGWLVPPKRGRRRGRRSDDAPIGGGAGPETAGASSPSDRTASDRS